MELQILRDRQGIVQVVFQDTDKDLFISASAMSLESVVCIEGNVRKRPKPENVNKEMATGAVEVVAESL